MQTPIDLSQVPPRGPVPAPRGKGTRGGKKPGRGTGLAIDEYARPVLWGAFLLSLVLLLFLLAGMYSGAWSKDALHHLAPADVTRQMANIALVFQILQVTSFVSVVCLLIIALRDEKLGYVLLGIGVLFYAGLPSLTLFVYNWRLLKPSHAVNLLMSDFQLLSWVFFVPGIAWTGADLLRRFRAMSEAQAIQRVNMKYGAAVPKQKAVKQMFLGSCWQLPYCREHVREKCPVYLKKRGPCWWHKEGCMCEERIILQAVITDDWKQKAARADAAFNFGQTRAGLSAAEKRDRCRKCVIYNEHQRQKYKALVTATLVLLPVGVYLEWPFLGAVSGHLMNVMEVVMKRFSFGEAPTSLPYMHGNTSLPVEYTLIGVLCMIGLTQILKFIEFLCFKLKV